jgi:hypothetical protein
MAPDWLKLSEEWSKDAVGMVAEIDCTTEGKPLCDANGVKGFPTLKYGDPADLTDYQGGRTYADLAKFATGNLKPTCSVANIELCDAATKKSIGDMMALSTEAIDAKITTEEAKLEKAEEDFKEAVAGLQETYKKLMEDKDATLAAVKESGLGLLKSVKASKAKAGKDEL